LKDKKKAHIVFSPPIQSKKSKFSQSHFLTTQLYYGSRVLGILFLKK